jgi:hypothetical protein
MGENNDLLPFKSMLIPIKKQIDILKLYLYAKITAIINLMECRLWEGKASVRFSIQM